MFDAFLQGGSALLQPMFLLLLLAGVILGLIIGVIPAIGSMLALTLMIPFVFRMSPELGMGFLVAMAGVTYTGGSITAILLGIPGTGINAATLLDGFPMTQKGEGARAIGAALTASMMGGILAALLALAMIPLIIPIVMAFRTPEMFMIIALGLAFMASLTGGSTIKGLISGLLGLMFALIGVNALTGTSRFTFDTIFLYEGLDLVPVALGLFGVAALIDIVAKGQTAIAPGTMETKLSSVLEGAKDVWRHKWLWLRSTVLAYIIGVIPGVGGSVATFMSYGHAKQVSKHPEKFGTGCVEGVIAPEASNNAKEGGGLLTTMVFGIPGTPEMAIMIGALFMVGVVPGPIMIREHLPLAFTLLMGLALANLIGGLLCFSVTPYLARVASISIHILFPVILVVIFVGAFSTKMSMLDPLVVMFFGILGWMMMRFGYSRPALILGLVLGNLFERYLLQATKIHGPLFFLTPISLTLLAIIILVFIQPYLKTIIAPWFKRRAINA